MPALPDGRGGQHPSGGHHALAAPAVNSNLQHRCNFFLVSPQQLHRPGLRGGRLNVEFQTTGVDPMTFLRRILLRVD
jgi:hypothetical protein